MLFTKCEIVKTLICITKETKSNKNDFASIMKKSLQYIEKSNIKQMIELLCYFRRGRK